MENNTLFNNVWDKSHLKQNVYQVTYEAFKKFKEEAMKIVNEFQAFSESKEGEKTPFSYKDKGDLEFEITFGGDVLLFLMHSNIFELPRNHEMMNSKYVKDDKERSYGGLIQIYNFLADSFKFGRGNDVGYMIGRLMVNKENHYLIEGKKEIGTIYHQFQKSILDEEAIRNVITSSIEYTMNFDLLVPPYEKVVFITVMDVLQASQGSHLSTGKRLGFRFQADKE